MRTPHELTLQLLRDTFAVCRLAGDAPAPAWAMAGAFFSITRTPDELSIVSSEGAIPEGVQCERGWRCLRVAGVIDFSVVGVLAALSVPLAEAGLSVFPASSPVRGRYS
ncbi:MAG: ACT domain-containing protein [Gemmataceae bacterium]|nr:ACT domain-containing protein [Gemmataceae bacterium]